MTVTRRALTLIEVLAATVLLTLIAATCVPLLRSAVRAVRPPVPPTDQAPFDRTDLETLADLVMVDPAAAGLALPLSDDTEIAWPDEPDRPAVRVTYLAPAAEADHAWLVFDCGPWRVQRWVEIQEKPEGQDQ